MKKYKFIFALFAAFIVLSMVVFVSRGKLFAPVSVLDGWGESVPDTLTVRYTDESGKNQYVDITDSEALEPLIDVLSCTNGFYFMRSDMIPVGLQLRFRSQGSGGTSGAVYPRIELPGDGFAYIDGRTYRISDQRQEQIIAIVREML